MSCASKPSANVTVLVIYFAVASPPAGNSVSLVVRLLITFSTAIILFLFVSIIGDTKEEDDPNTALLK